ncbi:SET domain-containing protein-lysine N-methyltransferase [Candidatus Woesearchaeota archaeon]|nr:SET domain-containing protein-lysine N-methyltransferase [Candidatus Woesearchaeota archaeon]
MPGDVIVKASRIHGTGVFAARDFRKGETVLRWDLSRRLTKKQAAAVPDDEKPFITFIGGKHTLLLPPERFVNHSCDNNTRAEGHCDVAVRDIREDEEITADYADDLEPGVEMACRCGSPRCRRVIRNLGE